jgi:RNA polymerase sigma-70 factor (ECF subfamily)
MDGDDWLTGQFEQHRPRLRRLCYRMLGSQAEADDALQDAWLRLAGTGSDDVQNPGGWLTTVVARVCLNRLRSRAARPEDPAGMRVPDPVISREVAGPGDEAVLADSVSLALLVVLDTLTPAERLAFVLHDLFDLPFEQIAALVDRSPAAARQLASRARRRVRGARAAGAHPDPAAQRRVVDAFFAAARGGDLAELIAVLDPDALLRADGGAARPEVSALLRGAADVARRAAMFNQPAAAVHPVLVNGTAGAVVTGGAGQPVSVMAFTIADGRIIEIDILLDPVRLGRLDLEGYVLSPAAAGGAVEQLAGDLEVAGVRRRLLDHGQDHLADVGDDVAAVLAARRVRQADAGHDRVGPLALRAVVGQHRHRRAVAGERHGRVVRRPPLVPRLVLLEPRDHLLEPMPLGVTQVLHHPRDRPAGRDDRGVPGRLTSVSSSLAVIISPFLTSAQGGRQLGARPAGRVRGDQQGRRRRSVPGGQEEGLLVRPRRHYLRSHQVPGLVRYVSLASAGTMIRVVRYRVLISGQVQGVSFRDACRRTAERHGVSGWVRNRSDGSVEAVFEGAAEDVERVLEWSRHGPRFAVVKDVRVRVEPPDGITGFQIR